MKNITIYSTEACTYCHMAKEYFKSKNLQYAEHNVGSDIEKRKEMVAKSGQMGVPVLDVGGTIIVGFDQEKIDAALAA
jgi:glutaredoxin-like YruB-family protein